MGKKVMFSVGEASGDIQAAGVASALLKMYPDAYLFGMGGSMMQSVGVTITHDIKDLGIVGLVEVLKNLRKLFRLKKELTEMLKKERPDVFVVVDYPGFNMRMAKVAKRLGIKVVSYIGPQIWAWGAWRAKGIADCVDHITSIFRFEAELYAKVGAKVTFVGHPLLDIVKTKNEKNAILEKYALDFKKKAILILPGSRKQEIINILPAILASLLEIQKKHQECRFFLPRAATIEKNILEALISQFAQGVMVEIVEQKEIYDLMSVSELAIATSGTVTLEAAIMGLPSVVLYKVNALTFFLGQYLVKIPDIALPNIVAGKRVLPELLQDDVNCAMIANNVCEILQDESRKSALRQSMFKVKECLGESGAVKRVAMIIAKEAGFTNEGK